MKILLKIGSNVLTPDERLNIELIGRLASEISILKQDRHKIAVVTSGAVTVGKTRLNHLKFHCNDPVKLKQIYAAIGQPVPMGHYSEAFRPHGYECGQSLLTRRDLSDEVRRATLLAEIVLMFDAGVIPIMNENDPVASKKLENDFTDNDQLAALVACLIRTDKLIILSDVPGLLRDCGDHNSVVPVVEDIDEYLHLIDPSAGNGKGGMRSKLETARSITNDGTAMVIASSSRTGAITDIIACRSVGTLFPAKF